MARERLTADELRPYRVDQGDDIYTRLQDAQGIIYDDALFPVEVSGTAHPPQRLFMPGCSLASYSQELTLAVYDCLCDAGEVDGISIRCCGKILDFSASPGECANYASVVASRLAAHNVTRVITACPNCYAAYTKIMHSKDAGTFELLALSEVLARRGLRFTPTSAAPFASICVHDSCPSRTDGVFAHTVRSLFEHVEQHEMAHSEERSRCCGQGKLLPLRNPEQSTRCTEERLAEFAATDADCLVTYCANCAQALRGANKPAYHYLELLFGIPIDWDTVVRAWQEISEGATSKPWDQHG